MRSLRRGYRIALAVAAALGAYPLAGLAGGAIPRNAGWRMAAQGVTIYVESNGVHVGLIVPKVASGVDWRTVFPPSDIADARYAAHDHLAIGWGDRDFFLDTPTWADVSPRTIIAAAIGSDRTLLHVEHIAAPRVGGDVRAIVLRPAEYRRLAAYIRATLVERGAKHRGYAGYDVFYTARGRYDAYHVQRLGRRCAAVRGRPGRGMDAVHRNRPMVVPGLTQRVSLWQASSIAGVAQW